MIGRGGIPPRDPDAEWYTVVEAARYLRFSERKVRQLIRQGRIRTVRPTGEHGPHRIHRRELDRLMA